MNRTEYGWRSPDYGNRDYFESPSGDPYTREEATDLAKASNGSLIARDVSPTRVVSVRN